MANIVVACIGIACVVMTYIVTAYVAMACIVTNRIVMADTVMAYLQQGPRHKHFEGWFQCPPHMLGNADDR